jgi:hypothetical protein
MSVLYKGLSKSLKLDCLPSGILYPLPSLTVGMGIILDWIWDGSSWIDIPKEDDIYLGAISNSYLSSFLLNYLILLSL